MNAKFFRLVFSRHQNMFVPVCEGMRAHGKSTGQRRSGAALLLAMLSALPAHAVNTGNPIPSATFATKGSASYSASGNQAYVTQTTRNAIVNFDNFNQRL